MSDKLDLSLIEKVRPLLKNAERILFITGAGMSADSGLPTYRGIGGLYDDADTDEGMPIEVAISGDMLRKRPEITWKYLLQIGHACSDASYNDGHKVIADIEQSKPNSWILTQNIDGFHRQAGNNNVIEIHGSLEDILCMSCSYTCHNSEVDISELPPRCPVCSGVLRHEVVLYGEQLPSKEINKLQTVFEKGFDLVFTIGTTSVFPYIAQPVMIAKQLGVPTVEINPGQSEVSTMVDYRIKSGAAEALRALWDD